MSLTSAFRECQQYRCGTGIGGAGGSASADVEQTAMLEMVGRERLAGTEQRLEPEPRPPTEQALDRECGLDA